MQRYNKIHSFIRDTTPRSKKPILSKEQIEKIKTVSGVALAAIGMGGAAALSVVAPGIFIILDKFIDDEWPDLELAKEKKDLKITKTFYYLKKSGQIKMKWKGSDYKIFLTNLGKKRLKKLNIDNMIIAKPEKWDGKWWQVAADIPTDKHKQSADKLRNRLKAMDFFPLQRTLWMYPHDPRVEVEILAKYYGIERFVTVMEISRLDKSDEAQLKSVYKDKCII